MITEEKEETLAQRRATTPSPGRNGGTDGGLKALVSSLRSDASQWIRQETALAKAEISEKVNEAGKNVALLIAGACTLYAGVIVLLLAAAAGAAELMRMAGVGLVPSYLTGLLVVGAVVSLIGWGTIKKGKNKLSAEKLKPERTADTLRNTKNWAKEKIHE
ncbi:MAG: phage holin family protein [Verrucomicrobiales bacterium]